MTLKDMKIKALSLIEEYYPEQSGLAEDEDVLNKINSVINQIQMDLMQYRKINAYFSKNITNETNKVINIKNEIVDIYQLNKIYLEPSSDYEMPDDNTLILPDDYVGILKVYYYKYPQMVDLEPQEEVEEVQNVEEENNENEENTESSQLTYDKTFVFDLDDILLEIMPYGIAADLLKMDMISDHGQYFKSEYEKRKNFIDSRKSSGSVSIVGGVDI